MSRWGSALASVLLVAVVSTFASPLIGATEAAWPPDREYARANFTAGSVGAPRTGTCPLNGANFSPTWQVPTSGTYTATSTPVATYQYRMTFTSIFGSMEVIPWTTTSATSFTYTAPLLVAGRYDFQVRSVAGTGAALWVHATLISGTANASLVATTACSWAA